MTLQGIIKDKYTTRHKARLRRHSNLSNPEPGEKNYFYDRNKRGTLGIFDYPNKKILAKILI